MDPHGHFRSMSVVEVREAMRAKNEELK